MSERWQGFIGAVALIVFTAVVAMLSAGCASVRYTERLPSGVVREFKSDSAFKDIAAKGEYPTPDGPVKIDIASSSANGTAATRDVLLASIGAAAGFAVAGPAGASGGAALGAGTAEALAAWAGKLSESDLEKLAELIARVKATTTPTTAPVVRSPAGTGTNAPATPATAAVAVWRAYDAPEFYAHGNPDEDAYRERAIADAVAGGFDCIRVRCVEPPGDELAVHLLRWRSPVDGEFKLGSANWTERMRAAGIPRTQWDVTGADAGQRARWRVLGQDYEAGRLQVLDGGKVVDL